MFLNQHWIVLKNYFCCWISAAIVPIKNVLSTAYFHCTIVIHVFSNISRDRHLILKVRYPLKALCALLFVIQWCWNRASNKPRRLISKVKFFTNIKNNLFLKLNIEFKVYVFNVHLPTNLEDNIHKNGFCCIRLNVKCTTNSFFGLDMMKN